MDFMWSIHRPSNGEQQVNDLRTGSVISVADQGGSCQQAGLSYNDDANARGAMPMSPSDIVAHDVDALRTMAREFAAGLNTRDIDRILRFYGETYVDVNLRHSVRTRDECRAYYASVVRGGDLQFDIHPDEIRVEGQFAFIRGTIEIRDRSAATDAPPRALRYLEIAQKQANGEWNVIWGMDGPIQENTTGGSR